MPFNVICLETSKPYECDGIVAVFATGAEAATVASVQSNLTGLKHQPRRCEEKTDWRERERTRFASGTYTPLPWADEPWYKDCTTIKDHFAHVSTEKDGKLAFTDGDERGAADLQTRINPGRYLTRFFEGVLTPDEIRKRACEFTAKNTALALQFAKTSNEIEAVYVTGPNSCMAGRDFNSNVHPCRIYGAGDLAVAYIQDGDGKITARALCWPEKLWRGRIYGDEDRLKMLLDDAGYEYHPLSGAKMLKIMQGGAYVMPYIDGCQSFSDDGDYLTIGGDLNAENTDGLSEIDERNRCAHCGETMNEDEECFIDTIEQTWCQHCAENHTFYCEGSGQTFPDDTPSVEMSGGHTWSQDYFDDHGFFCDACGGAFDNEDLAPSQDTSCRCQSCAHDAAVDAKKQTLAIKKARAHKAAQGRDEHPAQTELSLELEVAS